MGNAFGKPDLTDAQARGRKVDASRRREAARRQDRYADTRLENNDPRKDHIGSFAIWYSDYKIILAMLLAIAALVTYSLAAFGGTPLTPALNQQDGKYIYIKMRDTMAVEPKNAGNGHEWRFGLTGWCRQADVQDFGSPNK
jgi:hypothetical protein